MTIGVCDNQDTCTVVYDDEAIAQNPNMRQSMRSDKFVYASIDRESDGKLLVKAHI